MKIEIKIPAVGESVTEVTIANWLKKEGDYVQMDEPLCEVESEKATFEVNAEKAGRLSILVKAGETIKVGTVVAAIDTGVQAPKEPISVETKKAATGKTKVTTEENQPKATKPQAESGYAKGHPSPAAAKLMAENQLEVSRVDGSAKGGRITVQDVKTVLAKENRQAKKFSREIRREKMSSLRKTIARHLVAAKNQTAMLTTFNEVDMTSIMELRKKYKDIFEKKHSVGLGFMSFFTRACCIALRELPSVNARIEEEELVYHDYCDIGIAVSTPRGLVVPVIRNAESLSMAEIEKAVADLAKKGRDGKLSLDEMKGGTFTVTNGGVFGSLMSTPIINVPQSAILGMHKIQERPVAWNGQVIIRPMMYVALSYDHRIIDGKESVSFLVRVKELLENPSGLLLGQDPVKMLLDV